MEPLPEWLFRSSKGSQPVLCSGAGRAVTGSPQGLSLGPGRVSPAPGVSFVAPAPAIGPEQAISGLRRSACSLRVVFLQRRVQPACIQPRQHIPAQGRQQLVDVRNRLTPQLTVRTAYMQKLVVVHSLYRMKPVVGQCSALLLDRVAHFRPVAEHHAQAPQLLHLQQVGGGVVAVVATERGVG